MPKNNKIRQRINNNNKDSNNNNSKKPTKINSKSYTYDSVEKNTNKDKDGRFWRPKSENEKDKELEDWCEQWLARLIGMGIFAFTMFGFFINVGDYVMRSSMSNIDTNINLDGRIAVVTGGTDGIGREVAINLALAGARVYVGARNITNSEMILNQQLLKRHNVLFNKNNNNGIVVEGQTQNDDQEEEEESNIVTFDEDDDDDENNNDNENIIDKEQQLPLNYNLPEGLYPITSYELKLNAFKSVKKFATKVLNDIDDESISILINNAGTKGGKFACGPTHDGYNWNVQINYLSHFLLTQLFLPSMKKSHGNARVVHVTCAEAWNGKKLM